MAIKTDPGNYFEDFALGQVLVHATPRTASQGDRALYQALYGSRFALQSDDGFARSLGLPESPLDDMLVFHLVFGKTVPDISVNAIANLGYAEGIFGVPLYPGDSVTATSQVIGLKESSAGDSGIVYVRTRGANQRGEEILRYVRWVLVRKRDKASPAPEPVVPQLAKPVPVEQLRLPAGLCFEGYDDGLAGSPHRFGDYVVGERIDHADGMTIEEAEHMLATRLYQNTAKVHFNRQAESQGRFGRRIVYGGHVISLARALSCNGLANACKVLALNGGSHTAPTFAGDTLYAWSEVLETHALPGRQDAGILRLRTVALKDRAAEGFPDRGKDGKRDPAVVLDLDYSVSMPR
ncbi:MAG: MaoC family dehydratase [Rhodospirillales bacterium]|nr:MaoC family dehydratase [Rhodospirillales bacterium]